MLGELKKKKRKSHRAVFKTPGDARGLMNGVGANGDYLKPLIY